MAKRTKSGRRHNRKSPEIPHKMNVLLIGGGGREHALAWKMSQSKHMGKLWSLQSTNPAIDSLATRCPAQLEYTDIWRIQEWCDRENIHLIVVGPEDPLAKGIANELATPTRMVFGVTKEAAQLEADKAWAKQLMRSSAIPTAEARVFNNNEAAKEYVQSREDVPVIKASGLAAGKGVILPDTIEEALNAIDEIMIQNQFGDAGKTILIEEKLTGPEISILTLVDGRNIYVLEPCQDHKRIGEGDTGPNTGGMGAYSPVPALTIDQYNQIQRDILVPTLDALRREEIDYKGVLYVGLMMTHAGPKVLEYNCRFGDPETQPIMMRLKADLLKVMWATATGTLDQININWDTRPACCIVMASKGYPDSYDTGKEITGINEAEKLGAVKVFHAGTKMGANDTLTTAGGRVLSITALGDTLEEARDQAIAACDTIQFEGAQYRKDIAWRAISETTA